MRKPEKKRQKRKTAARPGVSAAASLIAGARRAQGLSKRELATLMGIDETTVGGWERGRFAPRDGRQRTKLAQALKLDVAELSHAIDGAPHDGAARGNGTVRLVDALDDFPALLSKLLEGTKSSVKDLRLAAPYTLPPFVQVDFRKAVAARLLDKTIEVQRVEIFYTLDRLREVLANILRYDGCKYYVRSFCPGISEVAPALGGYAFDDKHVILGGYFATVPPHGRPGIYLKGEPVRRFFTAYWDEIWRRGTALSLSGASDLANVRALARTLGLRDGDWQRFLEEATALMPPDGAPPRL